MIQPNELRIGNFVNTLLGDMPIMNFESMGARFSDLFGCTFRSLDPIPLTEDWLIKLGFYKDGFNGVNKDINYLDPSLCFKVLTFSGDYLYIREGMTKEPRHKDDLCVLWNKDIMKQFYVHQIQNLYFSITGKELILNNDSSKPL